LQYFLASGIIMIIIVFIYSYSSLQGALSNSLNCNCLWPDFWPNSIAPMTGSWDCLGGGYSTMGASGIDALCHSSPFPGGCSALFDRIFGAIFWPPVQALVLIGGRPVWAPIGASFVGGAICWGFRASRAVFRAVFFFGRA